MRQSDGSWTHTESFLEFYEITEFRILRKSELACHTEVPLPQSIHQCCLSNRPYHRLFSEAALDYCSEDKTRTNQYQLITVILPYHGEDEWEQPLQGAIDYLVVGDALKIGDYRVSDRAFIDSYT